MQSNTILYIIAGILLAADFSFIILLFSSKALNRRRGILLDKNKKIVINLISSPDFSDFSKLKIDPFLVFDVYKDFKVSILCPEAVAQSFIDYFVKNGVVNEYCKRIRSGNSFKRSEAALNLAFLPCEKSRRALETALDTEKKYYIKVYIINALIETGDDASIPYILQTLIGSPQWYNEKIYSIMGDFGEKLHNFLINLDAIESKELKMVIVSFAKHYFSPDLKVLLLEFMTSPDSEVADAAADACLKFYPEHLRSDNFIKSGNSYIKKIAVEATGLLPSLVSMNVLIEAMHDSDIYNESVSALSRIIIKNTDLFNETITRFTAEKDPIAKFGLAEVLSYRIEYLLVKLRYDNSSGLRKLIIDILARGNITNTITFLNENSDQKLEEMVCGILMEFIVHRVDITREFSLYLNERILAKLNLPRLEPQKGEPRQEVVRIGLLWLFLAIALLLFPAVYAVKYYGTFTLAGITGSTKNFFYLFNYFFAFYGISLNSIYLLLLLFSFIGSRRQLRNWTIKNSKFLFKPGILPSISIIAPAYGEEATIIQSVNSLLNLNYPDYEVIVVNDGSNDSTLQTLIDYFNLERADINVIEKLRTGTIRGLYKNRYLPNLLVVDKVNGGKADSLNAGINMAAKDYFCGIDADSLLERDSLLKMASPFLDTDTDIIATGGNIVPVNGCTVDKGHLTDIKIPSGFLPRLQTMEYIRSFISGRVGWATIRCLLIISGAFGLFKKSSVIEGGGYLTGKEKFQKDTVGEDMELVVRLIRNSRDKGEKGIVNYVFNANCWTEVPEDYSILRKQRDRWQRGLLDIMTFHIRMLFNPRYKEVGLIAFPYFIIFEVIGPWIEAQGLIVFLIALALGLLNPGIILLLFIGTIFMGLAVSIISLYIMERGNDYFPKNDISILILYAFCENFGIRQFFSVQRLGGYINALRNKQGWGRMVRKGFQSKT